MNRGLASEQIPTRPPRSATACTGSRCTPRARTSLFMQKHWDVMRSDDGGDSWREVSGNLPSDFGFPIDVHAHEPETIYVVPIKSDSEHYPPDGKLRVYRSRTGGNEWEALTKGLPQQDCYVNVLRDAMAVDALDPCGVYFGTTGGQVYASADAGRRLGADRAGPSARALGRGPDAAVIRVVLPAHAADPGPGERRGAPRARRAGHPARGARRARGAPPDAPGHDPRPRRRRSAGRSSASSPAAGTCPTRRPTRRSPTPWRRAPSRSSCSARSPAAEEPPPAAQGAATLPVRGRSPCYARSTSVRRWLRPWPGSAPASPSESSASVRRSRSSSTSSRAAPTAARCARRSRSSTSRRTCSRARRTARASGPRS